MKKRVIPIALSTFLLTSSISAGVILYKQNVDKESKVVVDKLLDTQKNEVKNEVLPQITNQELRDQTTKKEAIFSLSNPIKYLAIGDSITEGFSEGVEKIEKGELKDSILKGQGYPTFFVDYLRKADPNIIKSFSNEAISGSTVRQWNTLLEPTSSDEDLKDIDGLFNKDLNNLDFSRRALANDVIAKVKDANLITITIAANDYFKYLGKGFFEEFRYREFLKSDHPKEYLKTFVKSLFLDITDSIERDLEIFAQKLAAINSDAQIYYIQYPIPMLRIKNFLEDNFKMIFPEFEDIEFTEEIINLFNKNLNPKYLNPQNKENIHIINLYDEEYWWKNKDLLTKGIFAIHPGFKGYKRMAQELFLAFATDKNYVKNSSHFSVAHTGSLLNIEKIIELGDEKELLKKVFNNDIDADLKQVDSVERHLYSEVNNGTYGDRFRANLNLLTRFWIENSKKGYAYFMPSAPVILEAFLSSPLFTEIDPEQIILKHFKWRNNYHLFNLLDNFAKAELVPKIFQQLQNKFDDVAYFKQHNNGKLEINSKIFTKVFEDVFKDEKQFLEFFTIILNKNVLSGKTLTSFSKLVVRYMLRNNIDKRLSKAVLQKLLKITNVGEKYPQFNEDNITELFKKVKDTPAFAKLINDFIDVAPSELANVLDERPTSFYELFYKLIDRNKSTISIKLLPSLIDVMKVTVDNNDWLDQIYIHFINKNMSSITVGQLQELKVPSISLRMFFNIFSIYNNFKLSVEYMLKPIIRNLVKSLPKQVNLLEKSNENVKALNRMVAFLALIARIKLGKFALWSEFNPLSFSKSLHKIINKLVTEQALEQEKEIDAQLVTELVFGKNWQKEDYDQTLIKPQYSKNNLIVYIYYFDKKDKNNQGHSNIENIQYLFKYGYLKD